MAVKFRLGTKATRLPTDLESQCPLSSMNFWMYTSGKGTSMGQDWDYVSTVRAEELQIVPEQAYSYRQGVSLTSVSLCVCVPSS